jgi:ABC-2 type transport system ATP-binding protein
MEIIMNQVSKKFRHTTVIDEVSLSLHSGNVYGFQGINGSGKTMLMRLISGLIYPTFGAVTINGRQLKGQDNFPKNMGLLIENPAFLNGYSGYKNLELLAYINHKINCDEIRNSMMRVGLDPDEKKKYRKYSLGMKQRLGIACAIMEKPDLIILDEPLNSLDEDGIDKVLRIIQQEKERGALLIIACHDYESLKDMTSEIFRLVAGKIVKHLLKGADSVFSEVKV